MNNCLIFTDLHIGLKQDSTSRLKITINVCKEIINTCKKNNIKTLFFLGDLFHNRSSINVHTMNIALLLVKKLAEVVDNFYIVVGNHDIYYKNQVSINSSNMFKSIKNVKVIEKPTYINFNDKTILLIPWNCDLTTIKDNSSDVIMGHIDIPANYLIKSYIEENKNKNLTPQKAIIDLLEQDSMILNHSDVENVFNDSTKQSDEYIGDIVNKVKKGGVIFSGHIHKRKEFRSKGRNFIFVGSPYQQTLGEIDTELGYMIFNGNTYSFTPLNDKLPTHVLLKNSDILKNKDYNYSNLKNKIVKRIIDVDISREDESKIIQNIQKSEIYEELPPEYTITRKLLDNPLSSLTTSSELIQTKTSKVEYIFNYINELNQDNFKEFNIDKNILIELFQKYIKDDTEETTK